MLCVVDCSKNECSIIGTDVMFFKRHVHYVVRASLNICLLAYGRTTEPVVRYLMSFIYYID